MSKRVGFKATDTHMRCRDYQFTVGETHTHTSYPIELCRSGFHFCYTILDVFNYYYDPDIKVFKVIADGNIIHGTDKAVCNKIEFVEQLDWYSIIDLAIEQFNYKNSIHLKTLIWLSLIPYRGDELFKLLYTAVPLSVYRAILLKYMNTHWNDSFIFKMSTYHPDAGVLRAQDCIWNIDWLLNKSNYKVRRDLAKIGWNNEAYLTDRHNRVRTAALKYKQSLPLLRMSS